MKLNLSQPADLRFAENLPFYVNNSLPSDEHAWMQAYLTQHPQWQAEVVHAQQERAGSKAIHAETTEAVRLERLHHLLAWPDVAVQPQHSKPSLLQDVLSRPWVTGLVGVLFGALLSTSISTLHSSKTPPADQDIALRRGERPDCFTSQDIRIAMAPSTQWVDVAQLLRKLQLQLVSGPNQDGEVWVRASKGTSTSEALSLLRNNPAIEQAIANTPNAGQTCQP